MKIYYVNNKAQSNGDHEVHESECRYLPLDKTYLGMYSSCKEAVDEAKKTHSQSNGCYTCCKACHTS